MTSPSTTPPPPLTLLATLSSSTGVGSTRTWSSAPYPASSPSTPLLATASSDKSVSIWSLRDFRLLSTITGGHKRSVRCVGWKDWGSHKRKRDEEGETSSKGVVLATGSFDANVGVWLHNPDYSARVQQGDDSLTTNTSTESTSLPNGVEFDDPTSTAAGNAEDDEEWHFSTLLTGPDSEIKSLAFSPPHYSANLLATSSRDKSVWVWEEVEPDEWETIAVLQEHTGDVKCVAWNAGARVRQHGGEEEEKIVGGREILASGSYDDTIRLWRDVEEEGDWVCVGVLEGHSGTVWGVCWETHFNESIQSSSAGWEARIASCSDDLSIRIWRRVLSEAERNRSHVNGAAPGQRLPSIIRPATSMERWHQQTTLPAVHVRSIYALDWSSRTGLLASCGGDGVLAVYREVADAASRSDGDVVMDGTSEADPAEPAAEGQQTKWLVVAQIEAAHDEFEINHVCWALRRDGGRQAEGEEVLVSTGDDGVVRVWTLPEGVWEGR